jgi:hypothetical protein
MPGSRSLALTELEGIVQYWLRVGRVHTQFVWNPDVKRWHLRHAPAPGMWNLFGCLALDLAASVAGGKGVFCPFCQEVYFPKRRPTPGRGRCCSSESCRRAYFTEQKRKLRASDKGQVPTSRPEKKN